MDQQGMLALIFCFMLLAYASMAESAKSIFILAGQSNMVGEGGVKNVSKGTWDGIIPPECKANPLIFRLNNNLSWEEAREPLHQGIVKGACGIGPGMPFANSVLQRDPSVGEIGLVPCAVGGTSISQWMQGTNFYNQMLTRARAAVSNGGGVIRAFLWYQGEADTGMKQNAELYESRLEKLFSDLRFDLHSPSLPVFQVALASGDYEGFIEIVRKAQLQTELQNVMCVDAKGLELGFDHLHLTTASQVRLGTMLADAFLQNQMV